MMMIVRLRRARAIHRVIDHLLTLSVRVRVKKVTRRKRRVDSMKEEIVNIQIEAKCLAKGRQQMLSMLHLEEESTEVMMNLKFLRAVMVRIGRIRKIEAKIKITLTISDRFKIHATYSKTTHTPLID